MKNLLIFFCILCSVVLRSQTAIQIDSITLDSAYKGNTLIYFNAAWNKNAPLGVITLNKFANSLKEYVGGGSTSKAIELNLLGFTENLPVIAGLEFTSMFLVPASLNGWKINQWEISLGNQAHAAGTLVFDIAIAPSGGSMSTPALQSRTITLAANTRYGSLNSFTLTLNTGDIILVRFVSNTSITGSPKGLIAKFGLTQ